MASELWLRLIFARIIGLGHWNIGEGFERSGDFQSRCVLIDTEDFQEEVLIKYGWLYWFSTSWVHLGFPTNRFHSRNLDLLLGFVHRSRYLPMPWQRNSIQVSWNHSFLCSVRSKRNSIGLRLRFVSTPNCPQTIQWNANLSDNRTLTSINSVINWMARSSTMPSVFPCSAVSLAGQMQRSAIPQLANSK